MDKAIMFFIDYSKKTAVGLFIIAIGVRFIFGIPMPFILLLGISATVTFLLVCDIPNFFMYLGLLYVNIKYRFKPPSKENYTCKVDYMLPFAGKWTIIEGGLEKKLSHTWEAISQRYAYDFIFQGDETNLHSYICYEKEVLAAADGVVVKVSDEHPDSPITGDSVFCDAWDIGGNHIVIKHADQEYSVSSHLAPNSISVKVGDRVRQGEVVAKCGNSGNSGEPHLHFQLQSGKSFFFSAGLPIEFKLEVENAILAYRQQSCHSAPAQS